MNTFSDTQKGHMGWVRCVAVDISNEWFATGAADRIIKIWDLSTGILKLSLTGYNCEENLSLRFIRHIGTVRAVISSNRHPYLFSGKKLWFLIVVAAEDKTVKCWDLETNRVIRHYHGHLSGVYALALHPELDVLVSGK